MPASSLSSAFPTVIANVTDLQSFDGNAIPNNSMAILESSIVGGGANSGSPRLFRFQLGSALADSTAQMVISPGTNPAGGKWLLVDQFINLQFALDFNFTNNQVIFTVPTGIRLLVLRPFLEVGTPWTGGVASAIGVSSNNAAYNTAGDLMGGAGGDLTANLGSGFQGTAGTKIATMYSTRPPVVLIGGNTILWNRIVSAYTAGNGVLNVPCLQIF